MPADSGPQLDQARVAICERSWLDNLDLALHVMRSGGMPLVLAALVGAVPMVLVNYAVMSSLREHQFYEELTFESYWISLLLVLIEAPLATAPLTLFLGQANFVSRPSAGRIARDFFASLPQLLILQVAGRALLIVPQLTAWLPFVFWPYLNEVILLERNPLFGGRGEATTLKRSSILHRNGSGDFLVRTVAGIFFAPLLLVALWVTEDSLLSAVLGYEAGWTGQAIALQCSLWLVVTFFTVALSRLSRPAHSQRRLGSRFAVPRPARAAREVGRMSFSANDASRDNHWQRTQPILRRVTATTLAIETLILVVISVVMIAACAASARADDSPAPVESGREAFSSRGRFNWYDGEKDAIKPIQLVVRREWKGFDFPARLLEWMAWIALAVLLVAIVVALVWAIRQRSRGAPSRARSRARTLGRSRRSVTVHGRPPAQRLAG